MANDLSRRLFLRGAAVAAPALAIPATAALASSYVEENADLLVLEPELDVAIRESTAASAGFAEATRMGRKRWPRVPKAIQGRSWMGDNLERQITGAAFQPLQHFQSAFSLEFSLDRLMRKRNITLEVEEVRHHTRELLEIAQTYEAECKAVREAVGYDAAQERDAAACKVLLSVVGRIQAEPCKTMAGIRLKAMAMEAWSKHGGAWAFVNLDGRDRWMPDFCRALVQVMEA